MILVTGGAGYVGSHCVLALIEAGYDVVIFDNLELGHLEIVEALKSIKAQGRVVDFVQGDLKNLFDIEKVFKSYNIDAVVHFAAYSQVVESMKNPQKYYENNVDGTLNLLNSMVKNVVKKFVFSSSASIYGEPIYTPIDENHQQEPLNPYGETKLKVEKYLDEFDKKFGLKSVRLRYFNVVGADNEARIGEWHEPETHLIPNILKSILSNEKVFQMFGNDYDTIDGTCVRDYINVEDLVKAHLLALDYLDKIGETNFFNLGTNNGNSVKEIFSICEKITGKEISVDIQPRRVGDPAILVADNKKAKEILGWCPEKTLEESILSAYNWEKKLSK